MKRPGPLGLCCGTASVLALTASAVNAQQFDQRIKNTVHAQVVDLGSNGTPDSISGLTGDDIAISGGNTTYTVLEYDISSINPNNIELALIGGNVNVKSPDRLPSTYRFTLYAANGQMDTGDVAGTIQILGETTYDTLGPGRFGFDITTILTDRINAGDTHIGLRIEGVGNFADATLRSTGPSGTQPDIYVHHILTPHHRPEELSSFGSPRVTVHQGSIIFDGTNVDDTVFVDKVGGDIRFRDSLSAGAVVYGMIPESSGSRIVMNLYPGNDFVSVLTSGNLPVIVYGGSGDDRITGGENDDVLYGENGNDILNGRQGNDRLYGGDGVDELSGSSGDDSLFGGFMVDTLRGHSGHDRFLVRLQSADMIMDETDEDVVVPLAGANAYSTGVGTFADGYWTDLQVERLDTETLARHYEKLGTNALLKSYQDLRTDGVEYYRPIQLTQRGPLISGNILVSGTFSTTDVLLHWNLWPEDPNIFAHGTAILTHELGHVHDNLAMQGFVATRQWVFDPTSTAGLTPWPHPGSQLWRPTGAEGFVSFYAQTNTLEDFADSFEAIMLWPQSSWDSANLPLLEDFMGDYLRYFSGFPDTFVVWYEDFLGFANGTTDDHVLPAIGNVWITDISNATSPIPYRGVQNGEMEFGMTAGCNETGYGIWESEPITVRQYEKFTVKFDIKTDSILEWNGSCSDYFKAYAIVDGVSNEIVSYYGDISLGGTYTTPSAEFKGDEVVIRFYWKTTSPAEEYIVDNIVVEGLRLAPPLTN